METTVPRSTPQVANYPNAFTVETIVDYLLPQAGSVRLEIFDLAGRVVETVRAEQAAGRHQSVWRPSSLPSGLYFCRLHTADHTAVRAMLLAR